MADAHELVVDLLLLGLKLHLVWKRLPFASAAHTEVLAERLQTMLGRFYHTKNETFHIVLLLFGHLDVNYVSRYRELNEQYRTVDPCQCLSFCRHGFNGDVLQYYVLLLSCHNHKIKQPRTIGAAKILKLS